MSELEILERKVEKLSADDLRKFRQWFAEFDSRIWDLQIEADSRSGKFDKLISEALAEHTAGKTRPL